MATGARCCVRCLVTRGPHAGTSVVVCRAEAAAAAAPLLAIGRKKLCRLRLLRDLEVSSVHAEVRLSSSTEGKDEKEAEVDGIARDEEKDAMGVVVRDMKSTNGSKLNGLLLTPLVDYTLRDGDLIGVGRSSVRVRFVSHLSTGSSVDTSHQENKAAEASTRAAVSAQVAVVTATDDIDKENAGKVQAESSSNHNIVEANTESDQHQEPAREHTTEAHADAVQLQEDHLEQPVEERVDELPKRARRDDHDDEDAFESPKGINRRATNSNDAAGSSRHVSCMVCGRWLGLLDVLEQQLHINACLDGRVAPAAESSTALNGRTSRPSKPSKKRKRRGAPDMEQEQLTLAMALSKSLAGEGQQVDMQLALVRQELGQIDAQMAKLAKKRASLIKSMARLEKKATKLRKSRVRSPAEVRAFLRLELALDAMFPRERKAVGHGTETRPKRTVKRKRWIYQPGQDGGDTAIPSLRLSCLSQPESEQLFEDGTSEDHVSMWARASQHPSFDQRERQVYYSSMLLAFLPLEPPPSELSEAHKLDNMMSQARHDRTEAVESEPNAEEWMPEPESEARDAEEQLVPDVVKRAFPNWQQDLEFLRERSVEELHEALEELVRAREDGHLVLLTQSQVPTDGDEQLLQEHEREEACAYMESIMRRLLGQKMQIFDGSINHGGESVAQPQQHPIIELLDNEDEAETEETAQGETRYRGSDIPASYESVISISDSDEPEVEEDVGLSDRFSTRVTGGDDDETSAVYRSLSSSASSSSSSEDEEVEANGSCAGVLFEAPTQASTDAVTAEDTWTQEVATQAVTDTLLQDARLTSPMAASSTAAVASSDNVTTSSDDDKLPLASDGPSTPKAAIRTDKNKGSHISDVDTRILEALRAHEALYEGALLLRPLPLLTLVAHLHSVGLKYSREVVTATLDRHGITFRAPR